MDTVEAVALWSGLFASIVGVVLAVVSILFTRSVEARAAELNNEMIQTLQKIDSAVDRSTADIANLIKVAWDRMLTGIEGSSADSSNSGSDPDFAKEISAGVASELRSELASMSSSVSSSSSSPDSKIADLDAIVQKFQRTVERQLESGTGRATRDENDLLRARISSANTLTRALLSALVNGGHLTLQQYRALSDGKLGPALDNLRGRGLLVPLSARVTREPVYWISPDIDHDALKAFISMYEPTGSVVEFVARELAAVGYPKSSGSAKTARNRAVARNKSSKGEESEMLS